MYTVAGIDQLASSGEVCAEMHADFIHINADVCRQMTRVVGLVQTRGDISHVTSDAEGTRSNVTASNAVATGTPDVRSKKMRVVHNLESIQLAPAMVDAQVKVQKALVHATSMVASMMADRHSNRRAREYLSELMLLWPKPGTDSACSPPPSLESCNDVRTAMAESTYLVCKDEWSVELMPPKSEWQLERRCPVCHGVLFVTDKHTGRIDPM